MAENGKEREEIILRDDGQQLTDETVRSSEEDIGGLTVEHLLTMKDQGYLDQESFGNIVKEKLELNSREKIRWMELEHERKLREAELTHESREQDSDRTHESEMQERRFEHETKENGEDRSAANEKQSRQLEHEERVSRGWQKTERAKARTAIRPRMFIYGAIVLAVVAVVLFVLWSNGTLNALDKGTIRVPGSSGSFGNGNTYQVALERFKDAGFTNIETKSVQDVKIGVFAKPDEVSKVTINGDDSFGDNAYYPSDAKVVIYYHSK